MTAKSNSYAAAGVNIDLATKLLSDVKSKISATMRPEVLAPVGGFGGLFQVNLTGYREPVLVGSVDGVGTKLMVAAMMNRHDTVGHDLVNHCINDIAVQGAEPLYFMDYVGIGRLRSPMYEQILTGLAEACKAQGVSLLGGETAEMPGMYGDDFDLVGCITGLVDKSKIISGSEVKAGDVVLGIASNGLHTNGYSLARRVLFEQCSFGVQTELPELDGTVGDALLKPHICYWPAIKDALAKGLPIHGMAHITGGGWYDNLPRCLPDSVDANLTRSALPIPPIFPVIQNGGNIESAEMYRVFNMGCGMMWVLPATAADTALALIRSHGFTAAKIGDIVPGQCNVRIDGID